MATETSSITNQTGSVPAPVPEPVQTNEIHQDSDVEVVVESDDDLTMITPATIEIKREQLDLLFEFDENSITLKTENDENFVPNQANPVKRPIRRKAMEKKPLVERCVGRICAPKKRPRLTNKEMGNDAAGATSDENNKSGNEIIPDSEDETVSEAEGEVADGEEKAGFIDAIGVNLAPISFEDPIVELGVEAFTCEQCNSTHASKNALRSHYITKKHKSNVLKLARDMACASGTFSPVFPSVRVSNQQQPVAQSDPSLYCRVCDFSYSSKSSMSKHLKSLKHEENLTKEADETRH